MTMTMDALLPEVLEGTAAELRAIRERVGKPLAGVFKCGGFGDLMALCALVRAVQRHWGDRAHAVLLAPYGGFTPSLDIVAALKDGSRCDAILFPPVNDLAMLALFKAECETVYHCPGYAVKRFTRDGCGLDGQGEADAALEPYRGLYFDFPGSQFRIHDLGLSQWDIMSATMGFRVTPDDMPVVRDLAPLVAGGVSITMKREKTSALPAKARLRGVARYACIHNVGGGSGWTKQIPHDSMQAAIDATNAEGIRVVQIGAAGEYRYANVIDRRGFRWPIQVALLSGAEFFFGIEGSAAYAAYSVRCPALVSFGPTPACAFSFPGHIALAEPVCRPCAWHAPDWHKACRQGCESCVNHPDPFSTARLVTGYIHWLRGVLRDCA